MRRRRIHLFIVVASDCLFFHCDLVIAAKQFPFIMWLYFYTVTQVLKLSLEIVDGCLNNASINVKVSEELGLRLINFINNNKDLLVFMNKVLIQSPIHLFKVVFNDVLFLLFLPHPN